MKILRKFLADTPRRIMLFVALVINGMALGQTQISGTVNPSNFTTTAGQTKNFILTGDVFFSGGNSITVAGNLTIDLNGHVMQNTHYNYIVGVEDGGVFTLKDSNPTTKHYGKPETITPPGTTFNLPYLWNYRASYNASTSNAIEIDGGILTGGMGTMAGGVSVRNGGTFNLEGGTIAGCFIYLNGGLFSATDVDTEFANAENFDDGCFKKNGFGGGVYVYPTGTFNMTGGRICYNYAALAGGGVHTSSPNFNMTGGQIDHNQVSGSSHAYGGGVYVSHSADHNPSGQAFNGSFTMSGGSINNNTAYRGAGAFVTADATMTMSNNADVSNNLATQFGGGIELDGTSGHIAKLEMNGGSISNNTANSGGGVMEYGYSLFNMNGGVISGNNAFNTGGNGNGGGVYVQNATFNLNAGTLENNTATRYGGGVNINQDATFSIGSSGNVLIKGNQAAFGGGIVSEVSSSLTLNQNVTMEDNQATYDGGGMMIEQGTVTLTGAKIRNNTAGNNGGGIALNISRIAGTISFTMTGGEITGNRAGTSNQTSPLPGSIGDMEWDRSGGGISITANNATTSNSVTVNLRGGVISDNHLGDYGNDGGGVYVNVTTGSGSITLTNNIQIENNTANRYGGGVYFGNNTTMSVGAGTMTVKDNTVNAVPNNIYLCTNKTIAVTGAFDPQYVGIYTQSTAATIKVFTGTQALLGPIYTGMVNGTKNIFDDKQIYSALYPYNNDYSIFFSNTSPWSPLQQTVKKADDLVDNNHDGVYEIGNVKQLTAFLWYVNGITKHDNNFSPSVPDADAILTADINMQGHYWVPINNYQGTFDGNGYIISNLNMVPTNADPERGLFGVNTSGTIKNVNLRHCNFASGGNYIGSVVSQMNGGTLYNSVAQCQLEATASATKAGGLVGHINGGEVHSSISICEMTGFTMGGLAGKVTSGNLYNSFANPQFHYSGGSYFVGGLVAENTGTVANCYVRFSRTQSLTGAKFGQLAGSNTGSITDCYTPEVFASDVPSAIVNSGSATSDKYKIVDAPYLYNRPNDNLVGSTGKTLTEKLNNWVSAQGTSSEYAFWKRTTAGGYTTSAHAGNINDDYPIHKMKDFSCAASPDGLFIHYKASLNRMITDYNTLGNGTIWLYASPKTASNTDETINVANATTVKLYIDEDAALLQADGNTLNAFTSQTLGDYTAPNRGERWHYCSSSLTQSTIGFSYASDGVQFNWDANPCGVSFSDANDAAVFPGDLTSNDITKVDLYAFYEPEYHWINLKRNTNSHWHMNATTEPIVYTGNGTGGDGNETYLIPGKGYLMSIDKEQLLQNWGTLNNGNVTLQDITYNEANAWAGLLGYNLLGNPYQSYLDFNAFIGDNDNNALNASKANVEPTYAVYDPKIGAYIQFKTGSSKGSRSADGMIHPHQGFLIRRTGGSYNATATFKNTMRSTNSTSPFRSEQPAYPLVNLTLTDGAGNADIAVLELGRESNEGAEKLRVGNCNARISLALGHYEYAILFRNEVEDYQALHLEALVEGIYTLSWETANADFETLTLIDNITGETTDMLSNDSYTFEANPEQYASRFKIVIGDYKDVDENIEDGSSTGSTTAGTFAYNANGEIHFVDTCYDASLQIIDMTGRVIYSSDTKQTVSTKGMAPGVYILRLVSKTGTKIQKMVIG